MKRSNAGMTIPELLISVGLLLLVLGLATALFSQAFTHNTLTSENMSNEQQARIAMGKINSSLSQASVEANPSDFPGTPAPPVIGEAAMPTTTATPAIAFYRVASLNLAVVPSPSGAPAPAYMVHIISYDSAAQRVNEYVMTEQDYVLAVPSPSPAVLAQNVTDFGVVKITPSEFHFQITIHDVTNVSKPQAPYPLADNVSLLKQ